MEPAPIRFGVYEVDRASGELRRQGIKIRLPEQPLQVLLALLDRPGGVVTREELHERLWRAGSQVDFDRGLNKAINRVREALGDDADNPRFIETLPQRGYRFIGQLNQPPAIAAIPPPAVSRPPWTPSRRHWLAVAGVAGAVPLVLGARRLLSSGRIVPIESIAVLPLENLSGDPGQEYFSDGMTDALIGEIARLGSLRVTSRTSVMRFKKNVARKPLPEIAAELGVDAIVEGTILQSRGRVRITAQLISARDDRHLWSEKYEREMSDVLSLQSDVAESIVGQIRMKLIAHAAGAPRPRRVKPEAFEAYLRGNSLLQRGIGALTLGLEAFQRAIDLAPDFAEAYVGLGEGLCYAGIFGLRPSAESYPAARRAAWKALDIDPTNAAAHNVLADVLKGHDWNLAAAEAEYRRALDLNPSHLLTRLWYAECLTRMRRFEDALAESSRAVMLDPISPLSHSNRAMLLWRARQPGKAVAEATRALELDPNFANAYWWQGLAYASLEEFSKSIECLGRGQKLSQGTLFRALLGYVFGMSGQRSKALGLLREIETSAKQHYVNPVDFAYVHAGLGDAKAVFHHLEEAYRTRATRVHELAHPYFDRFSADPRYEDLLRRTGLAA